MCLRPRVVSCGAIFSGTTMSSGSMAWPPFASAVVPLMKLGYFFSCLALHDCFCFNSGLAGSDVPSSRLALSPGSNLGESSALRQSNWQCFATGSFSVFDFRPGIGKWNLYFRVMTGFCASGPSACVQEMGPRGNRGTRSAETLLSPASTSPLPKGYQM